MLFNLLSAKKILCSLFLELKFLELICRVLCNHKLVLCVCVLVCACARTRVCVQDSRTSALPYVTFLWNSQ